MLGGLCVLYSRKRSQVPIYVTAGLAEKANEYYKLLISWTNQKVHVIRTLTVITRTVTVIIRTLTVTTRTVTVIIHTLTVITRTVTVIIRTLMISWTHQKVRTTMEAA